MRRSRPRGLKPALTAAALAATGASIASIWHWGRIVAFEGGASVRLAGFDQAYYWQANLWIELAGLVLFLLFVTLPPPRNAPFGLRFGALAVAIFLCLEIPLARWLGVPLPEPVFLMIAAAVSGGASFYLLRGGPRSSALARLGDWLKRGPRRPLRPLLFVLGAGASILGWQWYYGGFNQIIDTISQISQARLLRLGVFTLDIPQGLRDVINFPSATAGVPAFSQFPPGYLMMMPPLIALGIPIQWINIVASGGIVALAAALARRIAGRTAGLLAGLMLACSPFFIGLAGTGMNHATACLALLGAAWCFLPGSPSPTRAQWIARSALGGLLLGWTATVRPLSALAHGLAWCAVWSVQWLELLHRANPRLYRTASAWTLRIAVAGGAIAPPMAFLFFYNAKTTGAPLKMGYQVSNPELHKLGFSAWSLTPSPPAGSALNNAGEGPRIAGAPAGRVLYTPADALENLLSDLRMFNRLLLGWGIGSWALLVPWWLGTRLSRGERVCLTLVAAQAGMYALYSYHHQVLGPRFQFEAFPLIVVLLAAGLARLLRRGGEWAGGLTVAALLLSLAGPAMGWLYFGAPFNPGKLRHESIAAFMEGLLPVARPTVVVFETAYIDHWGRYFPHDPGQPEIWFVEREHEAEARARPELSGCDWVYFGLSPQAAQ